MQDIKHYFHSFLQPLAVSPAFFSIPAICLLYSLILSLSMAAWDLSVIVEDLGNEAPPVTLSVSSDLHIGGVMLKLVEKTRRLLSVFIYSKSCILDC